MASNKRTWLWIIAGVFGTLFLFVVVLVGGAVYMFRTHVRNEAVEVATAEREFDEQRARFKGQEPLVEFVGDDTNNDEAKVHRASANAPRVKINTIRVLIYAQKDNRLIHVDIPGWFVRMMPESRTGGSGGIEPSPFFAGFQGDEELARRRITIADIERHGYGLVLDGHNPDTRILIWSE
jgi:hypothetical protein